MADWTMAKKTQKPTFDIKIIDGTKSLFLMKLGKIDNTGLVYNLERNLTLRVFKNT